VIQAALFVIGAAILFLMHDNIHAEITSLRIWQSQVRGLLDEMVADVVTVGSTSIPGVCPKPKIDVDVVLKSEDRTIRRSEATAGI
jgi:GrpB-like predicted nucleotidyltransferase (UPF0157 family)